MFNNNEKLETLEVRGLGGQVGIDKNGGISTRDIIEPLFSLCAEGDDYVLCVDNQRIVIPKYFEMNIKNISFFFHTISPTSESLAYSCHNHGTDFSNLKYKEMNVLYDTQNINVRIYEDVEYFIGSSSYASIFINNNEFAPYHAKILFDGNDIQIIDVAGSLKKTDENLYEFNSLQISF